MTDEPHATNSDGHSELVVLTLLLDESKAAPWSFDELARELDQEQRAADALASLRAAGLVHCCQQLVFTTRAARRFSELLGGI